jgi:diguanylate cyclase (GGDEF)-like protein/PAS domain S-box-containing protein
VVGLSGPVGAGRSLSRHVFHGRETAVRSGSASERSPGAIPFYDRAPERALLAAATLATEGLLVVQQDGARFTAVWGNPAVDRLLRAQPGATVSRDLAALELRLTAHDVQLPVDETMAALVAGGGADARVRRADGTDAVVRVTVAPIDAEVLTSWLLILKEVEDRVWADEELRASEERFRVVAAHAPIGVFASEVGLRLGYVNHRFGELWGRDLDEVMGTGWLDSVEPEDLQMVIDATCSVLAGEEIDLPIRIQHPEDGTRWVRLRATPVLLQALGAGFVGSVEDVTDETQHEAELTHQARHDPLTGLPNRVLLWEQIREVLNDRRAGDGSLALLFFDLDNFKLVNDSLGHVAGDQLLVEVANRLEASVRDGDAVARFGGDEFVVLCRRIASQDDAVGLADRLLREVARPMVLCGQEVVITASIGVVVTDDLSCDVESLVADADVAMYQAKERRPWRPSRP